MSDAANPEAPANPAPPGAVLVLGIGNVLWADEGFGVRCVEALQQRWAFDETQGAPVQLVDGGTQGLYLIQHVQAARKLLIFDAIDYGLEPGTLKLIENDEVPRFMGAKKMSLHQTGFQEVISAADLTGQLPESLLLIGVQPEELEDYGGSLRPAVKARLGDAVAIRVERVPVIAAESSGKFRYVVSQVKAPGSDGGAAHA